MKRVGLLIFFVLMPLYALAGPWEGVLHSGAGRPVGTGTDVFNLSISVNAGLRFRWNEHFSLGAQHVTFPLHLNRTNGVRESQGWATAWGLAPMLHLFPSSRFGSLEVGLLGGGYYEFVGAKFESGEATDRTVGVSYGGQIFYHKEIYAPFSLEIGVIYVRVIPGASCTKSAGVTSCEEKPTAAGNEGLLTALVGVTFTIPTLSPLLSIPFLKSL